MTLLVSWLGVDTHGCTSAYIAADSRISWGNIGNFDYGRKVFAFLRSPDILGYCGDVLFPTTVLSQIKEMADRGLLFWDGASPQERYEIILKKLVQQFHEYPRLVADLSGHILQVIYISRDPVDNFKFACWLIQWTGSSGWSGRSIPLPATSNLLFSLGSGKKESDENLIRYNTGPNHHTTRNIFHCFCDTLQNITDHNCGGAPQLVGIYRKPDSSSLTYGIVFNNKRYFLGLPIMETVDFEKVEWRNDLFERCDGLTMRKLESAQPQPDLLRRI